MRRRREAGRRGKKREGTVLRMAAGDPDRLDTGRLEPDKHREWFFQLLMRRPCTEREARERLERRRGLGEEDAEALFAEAREMSLLDDTAYARLFAEGHESWGNGRIAFELGRRGVSREDIRAALEDIDETGRARALVLAWSAGGLDERRIVARLRSRGFGPRAIRAACRGDGDIPW